MFTSVTWRRSKFHATLRIGNPLMRISRIDGYEALCRISRLDKCSGTESRKVPDADEEKIRKGIDFKSDRAELSSTDSSKIVGRASRRRRRGFPDGNPR